MKSNILFILSCLVLSLFIISNFSDAQENVAISSDEVKISFDVRGEGRPALVFVHGWSNNRRTWDENVSHFSQKYKVVTVDLAGFGESGNNRKKWNMASFGRDVVAVIKKLNLDQVVLIGHSMGGAVIIETSKMIPKQISGIVLVDILQNIERRYSQQYISNIDSGYMASVIAPNIKKWKTAFKNNPDALSKRYFFMVENVPKIGWSESLKDFFRWSNEDCIESLKTIQIPITSINSDQNPTNVEAFKKYHPSFEVKIIPNVSHYVTWEAPEQFNLLLEESIQEFINGSIKK